MSENQSIIFILSKSDDINDCCCLVKMIMNETITKLDYDGMSKSSSLI